MAGKGNVKNLKPFKKGDPRINRNGRPKSFDKLRKLAQQISHEVARGADGKPVVIDNQTQTQLTMLLRQMMQGDPVKFLEYAFGKPKEVLDITSAGEQIKFVFGGTDIDDDI